jgi:hypothetical protein
MRASSPQLDRGISLRFSVNRYSDMQKPVPVKLARLLPYITIGCCFDSHPRINSALQKPEVSPGTFGERYIDMQKPVPVKLARLLPYINIGFCFDSHPRIDSALQKPAVSPETCGERYIRPNRKEFPCYRNTS